MTDAEIEAEAARTAQAFGVSTFEWYRTLREQRGIAKEQYLQDIIAINLKLRKLGIDFQTFQGHGVSSTTHPKA